MSVYLDDDQRSLEGCPPPTDETGASRVPSENMLPNISENCARQKQSYKDLVYPLLSPNISPGPIPEKANADMAIGNSIDCDNLVNCIPDVLNSAKQNFERFFDLRPVTSTQEQIDRSSLGVHRMVLGRRAREPACRSRSCSSRSS